VPTATGVIDRLSVRGRAAMSQDERVIAGLCLQSMRFLNGGSVRHAATTGNGA
jgi:hypothetical protein